MCADPRPATQRTGGRSCSVESCEQAKTRGWRAMWKAAGEAGRVGLREYRWGFSAGGRSLGNRNMGQSWGLVSTQRGFLPIPALQGQEAGRGQSPDSEYLRGLKLNFQAG